VDVIVADGFTGNVALKTMEGAFEKFVFSAVLSAVLDDETRAAGDVLLSTCCRSRRSWTRRTKEEPCWLGVEGDLRD